MSSWINTLVRLPPNGMVVDARDSGGHVQRLKRQGNLWWTPDDVMYVYYVPQCWRYVGGAAC